MKALLFPLPAIARLSRVLVRKDVYERLRRADEEMDLFAAEVLDDDMVIEN